MHKKITSNGYTHARGELGGYLLAGLPGIDIVTNIIQFTEYLQNKSEGSVVLEAWKLSQSLVD